MPEDEPEPRYSEVGWIGSGGGGEVRRVLDQQLHRTVARKTMRRELSEAPRFAEQFLREARLTARLEHPGIIPIYEVGEDPQSGPWFTMKEVKGRTLTDLIVAVHGASPAEGWSPTDDGWSLGRLLDTLRRVAEAVGYAHSQGVLHRDLKPSNIMVGAFGEVFLMDWGVALPLHDGRAVQPSLAGTPAYMSPEQAAGAGATLSPASDVCALGLLLCAIVLGRQPFEGDTAQEILEKAQAGLSRSPVLPRPVPEDLRSLLVAATHPDPRVRPEDGSAFADAIRLWQEGARRRERAQALLDEAVGLLDAVEQDHTDTLRQQRDVARRLRALPTWAGAAERQALWAEEDEAERRLVRLEATQSRAVELLRLALTEDPTATAARSRLADLFEHRLAAAERAGEARRAAHVAEQLRATDPIRFASIQDRQGRVTLETSVPAQATLLRVVEEARRRVLKTECSLGTTPLRAVALPPGPWVVRLEAEGHIPVVVPVLLERGRHWDGVPPGQTQTQILALPATGTLGPDDIYVPGGWHLSSTEPDDPSHEALVRTWVDPFVMRRHPVTIGAFQDFLNALVRAGQGEAAEAHLPRYMLPQRPGMFAPDADGLYRLVPDPDGDELNPDWPVFLVTASAAEAYAAWEAQRTGQPWRLPWLVEREKAARSVDGRLFPWGDEAEATYAVCRGWRPGRALPVPVHTSTADVSLYGVHGLAGGIQDWCRDRWDGGFMRVVAGRPLLEAATEDQDRVVAGGSWNFVLATARADKRYRRAPSDRRESLGFRLARSLQS